jgi:hypothetical protein
MRIVPILLLLANVLVAAYFFVEDRRAPADTETARPQINPEEIRILGTNVDAPAGKRAKPTEEAMEPALSCAAWGSFPESQVAAAETRLASLELGARLSRRETAGATSYLVMIPPIARRADINQRVEELNRAGVTDHFVINDGESRNGISLGFFKTEDAANRHLGYMKAKGVSDAIVKPRSTGNRTVTFMMQNLSDSERSKLEGIADGFPAVEVKIQACPFAEGNG